MRDVHGAVLGDERERQPVRRAGRIFFPLHVSIRLLQAAIEEVMAGDATPLQKANAVARLGGLYLKAYRVAELEEANARLRQRAAELEERTTAAEAYTRELEGRATAWAERLGGLGATAVPPDADGPPCLVYAETFTLVEDRSAPPASTRPDFSSRAEAEVLIDQAGLVSGADSTPRVSDALGRSPP